MTSREARMFARSGAEFDAMPPSTPQGTAVALESARRIGRDVHDNCESTPHPGDEPSRFPRCQDQRKSRSITFALFWIAAVSPDVDGVWYLAGMLGETMMIV